MDWFPFHISDLAQDRVAAASASAFGSWVRMLAACYKHENNGCYEHCSEYSDRQWMSIAGVSVEEVEEVVSARLATWVGDKLCVEGYDHEQQDKATKRSNKGKLAAKTRWENTRSNARSNAEERKGKESRGKEEGEDPPARDPSATGTEYEIRPVHLQANKWHFEFSKAWCAKKGKISYGHPSDGKAKGNFDDMLNGLDHGDVLQAWDRRREIFEEFLTTNNRRTQEVGHIFAFFVTNFLAYLVPKEKRDKQPEKKRPRFGGELPENWMEGIK